MLRQRLLTSYSPTRPSLSILLIQRNSPVQSHLQNIIHRLFTGAAQGPSLGARFGAEPSLGNALRKQVGEQVIEFPGRHRLPKVVGHQRQIALPPLRHVRLLHRELLRRRVGQHQ